MPSNQEKLVLLFEAQNKDVLRKLNQIERSSKRSFNNSRKPLKAFSRDMQQAANSARGFAAAFAGGFTGVLVAGGIAGLPGIIRGVVSETSKLGKVADRVNLTTDALQRLRYGFDLAGVASTQTDVAMQRFARRVAQAANGSGELFEILNQNGVALRNQDGSMRSQIDILRDYANLIKGARSEQEQLLLAFKAFDTEGAGLVNALRGGAAGLDILMQKADEAGGVLDERLVREAEKIDDQFAALWRNFETNAKSAILSSVSALGSLGDEINALGMALRDSMPEWMQRDNAARILRENLTGNLTGERRLNNGLFYRGDIGLRETNPAEVTVTRPTIMPQKRDASSKAADRQAASVKRLIAALELEQAAIGKTALEQRVMNELSRAGEGATDAQREQIRSLVTEIERQRAAQERVNELTQFGGQLIQSQFGVITDAIDTGNAALDRFLQTMIDASLQAALLGQGPLASLLGGGGSGGGLLSLLGFGGFRANGGDVQSGRGYIVGEKGPEFFAPKSAGTIIPNHALGGGTSYAPTYVIDARGSDMSETRFRQIIEENNRKVVPEIAKASVARANRLNTSSAFRGR